MMKLNLDKQKFVSIILILVITLGTPYLLYWVAEKIPLQEYESLHWILIGWFLFLLDAGLWKFFQRAFKSNF